MKEMSMKATAWKGRAQKKEEERKKNLGPGVHHPQTHIEQHNSGKRGEGNFKEGGGSTRKGTGTEGGGGLARSEKFRQRRGPDSTQRRGKRG